jgi:hypothetical protein
MLGKVSLETAHGRLSPQPDSDECPDDILDGSEDSAVEREQQTDLNLRSEMEELTEGEQEGVDAFGEESIQSDLQSVERKHVILDRSSIIRSPNKLGSFPNAGTDQYASEQEELEYLRASGLLSEDDWQVCQIFNPFPSSSFRC